MINIVKKLDKKIKLIDISENTNKLITTGINFIFYPF